jgi:hypothetical protein
MFLTLEETRKLIGEGKLLHIAADESLLEKLPEGIGSAEPRRILLLKKAVSSQRTGFLSMCLTLPCRGRYRFMIKIRFSIFQGRFSEWFLLIPHAFRERGGGILCEGIPEFQRTSYDPDLWMDHGFRSFHSFFGQSVRRSSGKSFENKAVVLHVGLPEDRVTSIGIVNISRRIRANRRSYLRRTR